ncbi:MAG: family ATPase [Gammaproteobacteria bacterium]|nr:family ATPase [Gammaproteobacteria bacterium]
MYKREISSVIQRLAGLYPIIGITGPRQSGKTTIAKFLFPTLPYVSLENLDVRLQAEQDPRAFLNLYQDGAIFDEVQNVPTLLSYLQGVVDEDPKKGRYVITGSQNFALSSSIAQSLPGRIGMMTLLPLSLFEIQSEMETSASIFKGGYPGLHQSQMQPMDFYPSYIQTYIERDVRQLKGIENLGRFQIFLKLCAGRIGQLINFSSLAQDAGISHTTAREWLTVLEASYILFTLQPYYQNFNKRLMKMPKMYFYDTGLACALLGLEKEAQIETHYLKGSLFENLVVLEILKGRMNNRLSPNLYFWRDRTGHEVDLIGEWGGHIHAMEIKYGATFQESYGKNLKYFMQLSGEKGKEKSTFAYLIYTGSQEGSYRDISLTPINKIHEKILNS